jgi:hypothetical protein
LTYVQEKIRDLSYKATYYSIKELLGRRRFGSKFQDADLMLCLESIEGFN